MVYHTVRPFRGEQGWDCVKRVPDPSFLLFSPAGWFSEKQPWLVIFTICTLILLTNTLKKEKKKNFCDAYLEFAIVPVWICQVHRIHHISFPLNQIKSGPEPPSLSDITGVPLLNCFKDMGLGRALHLCHRFTVAYTSLPIGHPT